MSFAGGSMVTLVGQSGSGKTTQIGELLKEPGVRISTSTTTRQPRPTDLPHEYWYKNLAEYESLASIPGRFLWNIVAGNGDRYTKDVCDLIEALTDPDHMYVNALIPACADILVKKYGREIVRTIFLPNPDDDILLARMIERGDDPHKAKERLVTEREANWSQQPLAIDGLYVVKSQGIQARHEEIMDFLTS